MIIKSMARKSPSFHQLAKYMDKGKKNHKSFEVFYNNLYSRESEGISDEFKKNAENLRHRKNGNYLYHEVISITRSHELDFEKQKEILYSLVNDYVQLRAKRNLVYGIMHTDKKDNLHYHLMISSNELGSEKRHRLNKSTFANIQKSIEKNVLNNFPDLGQKIIYNQNKAEKTKKGEYELKRRTGKESQRDKIKRELTEVFETAKGKADFFNKLADAGFEVYVNGNTIGVTSSETGRNYRLKTLGLLDKFNTISGKIEEVEHRKEEIKESRGGQDKTENVEPEKKQEEKPKQEKQTKHETEVKTEVKQEAINEVQAEIERRKQELKKQREAEQEYNNDYGKGDKSLWYKVKGLLQSVIKKTILIINNQEQCKKFMRLKMIDWLGMFDVFFSTFSSTKAVVEPLPEEKKKKPEKTVVIQREVASRKAELKKKREQSHNRDYEIERNR